jgi:hypothetical protein
LGVSKKDRPPKEIFIVTKWYSITPNKEIAHSGKYGTMAQCTPDQCLIEYVPGTEIQNLRDAIWHEVNHGVFYEMGLGADICMHKLQRWDPDDLEESIVRRVSTASLAVLRENPDFTDWLTKVDK